jgi:hypothetical protein
MGGGKGFTPELVIGKLGEAAVPPSEGLSGAAVCGTIGGYRRYLFSSAQAIRSDAGI